MFLFTRAIIIAVILGVIGAPLAAQSSRPINLFSLETNGAGTPPLHVFRVNSATGALSEVPGSPFAVGSAFLSNLAVDPTGRFVYVTDGMFNDIVAFAIDATTGSLTPLPGSPFLTGNSPGPIAIDPTGRFVYVSTATVGLNGLQSSDVYVYAIDSGTGVLTAVSGSPFAQTNIIDSITFDPTGNYVFFGQNGPNPSALLIDSYDFAAGALVTGGSFGNGVGAMLVNAMDPSGQFLYATNPASSISQVRAFAFNSILGSLSEIQGSPFPAAPIPHPSDLKIDPFGKFLYVVNHNYGWQPSNPPSEYAGSISTFAIDSTTGALTPISGSPFAAGSNPLSMVVDPTGHFAYAGSTTYTTGTLSFATVLGYAIDGSTGALTPLTGSPWMDALQYSVGALLAVSYGPVPIPYPVPMLSSLSPSSVTAGSAGFTLQVNGLNFVHGSTVYFSGQPRPTTFVNASQVNADILSNDISNGVASAVFVFNPLPGGGASNSVEFSVLNPSPTISSINPSSVVAGRAGFTLVVNGSNFVTGSIVNFNATARSTTYVSSTEVALAILAGEIANQGTASITVTNPANGVAGGGTSGPATLTILPAGVQPTIGTLVPASATAGAPAFPLAVTGTGFTPNSVVSFNVNNEPTTYVSSTQLQAAIPASAIAVAGTPFVTVTNPGGSASVVITFTVNNPVPGVRRVLPSSVPVGNAAATLAVTGANFNTSSMVLVNGSSRATTFVSSTSLDAALPASDFTRSGTLNIAVNNPIPGGGTTPSLTLVVGDFILSVPTPGNSVVAGNSASYSLMVTPSNGATANSVTFSVSSKLPTGATASFSPATVPAGSGATTVTLSISTTARSVVLPIKSPRMHAPHWPALYLAGLVIVCTWVGLRALTGRVTRFAPQFLLVSLLLITSGLIACGGVTGSAAPSVNPATGGTPAGTYSVIVTATSGNGSLSTTVSLTVI